MHEDSAVYVGLDTSKLKISVALAQAGRDGEVRFLGDVDSAPEAVERLVRKLEKRHRKLFFAYEAGPTGYGLQRQITGFGHDCAVVAPSLVPKRPGERVKTNRRDALTLAKLHRAGELTPVWVPDPGHEAMRELVRAREAAMEDLRAKRQHLQSFLLRHGRVFPGRAAWTRAHTRRLCELAFEHPAQHLVLAECRQAIMDAETRLERLARQVGELVPSWSMAPVIAAYQALRGVAFLSAVTFAAAIGDVRRFDSPRRLMAHLGPVPAESSTGERVRRGGITKAGNGRARRVRIEGAWSYRFRARMSRLLEGRQAGPPKAVREIAWKAQVRLCGGWGGPPRRYRKLMARGKRQGVVTSATACDGRLPVGDRPRSGAAARGLIGSRDNETRPTGDRSRPDRHTLLRTAGGRAPAGEPSSELCGRPRRRPLADRGSPGRTHGNAVANPRIRVCSPSSQRLCPLRCATAIHL